MAAPRAASAPARLLLTAAVATAILHTVAAMGACGTSPKVIYVSKGDKKRVRFWNTEAVESPLSGDELAEGSGQESPVAPGLEPLATLVAAGVSSAPSEPPLGAAETTPFVVTPAGPEATTEAPEPLYDTQPHIVLPEPQQDAGDRVVSSPATQDASAGAVPAADATTPEEIVKTEHNKAEAGISDVSVVLTENIVPGEESIADEEGSGEDIKATTEREYLTTFDPYDLVAIANADVEASNLQKRIPPELQANEQQLEGSGDNATVPASATIPLNKYQEINISSDSADTDVADVTNSHFIDHSDKQGTTVMLEDPSEQAVGEDRLIAVTGFSGDRVLVEYTPDEEASGETETENDAEGSGTLEEGVPVTFNSQAETGAVPGDSVAYSSATYGTSDSSLSLAEFAAELPLNMVESGPVEALTPESDAAAEETDELLPMVQPSSVHQLLSSLKLSHSPNGDDDKTANSHSHSNVGHESIVTHSDGLSSGPAALEDVPAKKAEGGSTEGDLTQLDRLLLVQGFTNDDRVILEHIPDPPSASGSGQGDDNDATDDLTTFESLEGSATSEDFHYESSGDSLYDIPQNSSIKVANNWVAKEKHAVMSGSSRTEIPDMSEIEVIIPKIPELKESGLPIATVEESNHNESLPLAETEGFPLPESLVREENDKETEEEDNEEGNDTEEEEKSKKDLEADESESEEQKAEIEPGKAASEDQPLPVADTEAVSPDTESISIVAATDNQLQRQRAVPLSRESLLNNIYRLLNARNPRPSRFTPDTRPSWAGFGALRRRPSTAAPLPTEQTVVVGGDETVLGRPSFYQVYGSAQSRPQRGGSRRVRSVRGLLSRTEQQESAFDPVESLRHPDDRLFRFIRSQPYPLMSALLNGWPRLRSSRLASAAVDCEWQIKTEPHLYLLVTLNNLGAPYTVNCDGAYIEVERERDGFEARWCGNRIKQSGSRPHMVFARGEVRIAVFNDGDTNDLPTGFEADVEVVDLLDARQYSTFRRSGLNFRRLGQHPVFPIW